MISLSNPLSFSTRLITEFELGISPTSNPFRQSIVYAVSQSVSRAFATALTEQSPTLFPDGDGFHSTYILSSSNLKILYRKETATAIKQFRLFHMVFAWIRYD